MIYTIFLFILAGIAEIGGGYLIWIWLREGKPSWYGVIGGIILILYGIIPTFQKFLRSEEYMRPMVAYLLFFRSCGDGELIRKLLIHTIGSERSFV